MPILLSLGLLYPVASMISYMVKEKEYRQKELLKMMSVSESDIGWSWFVTFFLFHLVTATLCGLVSRELFDHSEFLLLWLFWLFTMLGTIVFCMAISSFTSKSTRAVLIGILVFFSGAFLTLAQPLETGSRGAIQVISLHPISAFSYGVLQIGHLEENSVGLTLDSLTLSDNRNGYSFRDTLTVLLFDSILWGFLAWYLNRVIAPDYGQALPIWFPFMPSYWCSTNKPIKAPEEMAVDVEARNAAIPYEPVGDLKRQVAEGKSIEINNLRKSFGDKVAVDDLNLSIYSGQITALLGHNGMDFRLIAPTISHKNVNRSGKDNHHKHFDRCIGSYSGGCNNLRQKHPVGSVLDSKGYWNLPPT
jgi:ATP-binding cassette, subfamily A (ABC1), member 3